MTKYGELSQAFDTWRKDYFNDFHSSVQFARWFANAFREYIGAPDEFISDFQDREQKVKYVRAMACTPNDDGITYSITEPKSYSDIITMSENGFFQFGLSIALESAPNVWPKQFFNTLISFALQDEHCLVYVFKGDNGVFKVKRRDDRACDVVFDYIVSLLLEHLAKKQTDRVAGVVAEEPPPEPMGFISFPRSPNGTPEAT